MHVVFRESHGLEEADTPTDLGQSPADLVVLSFSDSDLGAFAEAWHQGGGKNGKLPSLRLANLAALKHPLSVDTYVEQTLDGAKGILIRLIGGVPYWSYGLQQVERLARAKGIALAVLPADGRPDARLDEISTLPGSTLKVLSHLCDQGGAVAAQAALAQMALAAGLYAAPVRGAKGVPSVGAWSPEHGVTCPVALAGLAGRPNVAIVFYRSYLVSADTKPLQALWDTLSDAGFVPVGLFVPSLKAPDAGAWLARQLKHLSPKAIVNATAFSGKTGQGASPLDAADAPVFQVALATSTQEAWREADRGLAPADLAMHVVLPEVDGRLFGGVVSFKEPQAPDPDLQFSRYVHTPNATRIDAVVARLSAWDRLSKAKSPAPCIVLSTYPGRDWNVAHAVGLDAIASAHEIAQEALSDQIEDFGPDDLLKAELIWPWSEYEAALKTLPCALREALTAAWGAASDDPAARSGGLALPVLKRGAAHIALQPERGNPEVRFDEYHDLARVPRHGYVAFYLWAQQNADCLIHVGAHGTLEWLPGKAVALSDACWPEALTGHLPVIYPFIVNDPGEAAQAKRRIGAMTLGHVPPPLKISGTPERLAGLEALLDEFSNADGLDPKRRDRLMGDIQLEASALGLNDSLGLDDAGDEGEAITRIDRFVCDVKDSQFGDGLHVWGQGDHGASEREGLKKALNGQRVDAGPAGSPYRGRTDVLPTGRNLFSVDPRAVPTRNAYAQGQAMAQEVIRRHLQEEGDWPRAMVVDLWGSATMRTAGEEFAMALALMGIKPRWDEGSERVSGIDILPIAEMEHPRVDVTLRISGLFRDVFPSLSTLFNQAVRALGARDEAPDWNPYVTKASARVYGPAPGSFGAGLGPHLADTDPSVREAAGKAWLTASSWALDGGEATQDLEGLKERVANAEAFVHAQDLLETDLLLSEDYAAHEAGFAAAQTVTGGQAALYHLDTTNPETPRARMLTEEIARVVQARASNPDWIAGMQRHGHRGGAEIAATLENLAAFATLANAVPGHLFDLYFDATLANDAVDRFLQDENHEAWRAMQDRFRALIEAGFWTPRRNSTRAALFDEAAQ